MDVSDQGGVPRGARIGGEERVTLELFFDLVFVFALTQVTGFPHPSPHVAGDVAGRRAAHGAMGGVGGVLLADQRRAGRGGDPSAAGDLLRDGCHVRGLARCPRRLRRVWGALRGGILRGVPLAHGPFRACHRTRAGAPGRPPARTGLLGRPCCARCGRLPRRLRPGCAVGCGARTRVRRGGGAASRASGSTRGISPSATASW